MRLAWCGHSYFVLSSGGQVLAIDPHDGDSLGLERCKVDADYVLITHDHYDHNAAEVASGPRTKAVLRFREVPVTLGPFRVRGFRLPHDSDGGSSYGWSTAYMVEAEGLRVLHMGDVGVPPDEGLVSVIGPTDVIMVPAGDVTTVGQEGAVEWALRLNAKLVIPMHYWVRGSNVPLDPLDSFLSAWRGPVERAKGPLELSPPLRGQLLVIMEVGGP